MKHFTPNPSRRYARAFLASLLSYLLLVGQFAPMVLAANSSPARALPAGAGEVQELRATTAAGLPAAPLPGPTITATKVDSFTDGPEADGKVDPGQDIDYEVTVTNTGDATATNVQFSDLIEENATLDTDSITMSPLARNDSYTASPDSPLTVNAASGVLGNDSGLPAPTAVAIASGPTAKGGTVTLDTNGSFTYTPPPDPNAFTGTDKFTYTATNSNSPDDTATVTIDFNPAAVDDSLTVSEDAAATTLDVLANDPDPDAGAKSIDSVTQPADGTVVITNAGADLTYQPDADYCNTQSGGTPDTFTYTLTPGGDTATVSVTVTCVDDAPVAVDDSATVAEDAAATTINVLTNDTDVENDAFTIDSVTQPADGTVVITNAGADLTYQPDADYCNTQSGGTPDTFTYTLTPGGDTATVSVTVTCSDDAPTAVNDSPTVSEDSGANNILVLANDTDIDGGDKLIASATQPANGTVVLTGGTAGQHTGLTYAPNANYCNSPPGGTPDTFTYTLTPGISSATVSVTVLCDDDPPVAVTDSATVAEDSGANTINVLLNDTDIDGGPKSVGSVTQPANGTVAITNGGADLTYTPNGNDNGPDSFTYTLTPGSSSTTVNVTVTEVNDAPTGVADVLSAVFEDSGDRSIPFATLIANDSAGPANESGQTLIVTNVSDPTGGTVEISGTDVIFHLTPNFFGTASFTYTVTDNGTTNGAADPKSATATVSFTVNGINDEPSFTKGADQTVDEDAGLVTGTPNPWATAISAGPGEGTQTVSFVVTNDNNGLFSVQPAVSPTGVLTFTTAANQNGVANVTIKITDNGGTDNGGDNESPTQTFTITVTAVNDKPVVPNKAFTVQANMRRNGLTGLLEGVTDADTGVNGCTPTFMVTNVSVTSPAGGNVLNLDAANGTFDFDPPPGVSGVNSVTFTYTVTDNGCPGSETSLPATVTVSVNGPVIWFVKPDVAGPGDGRLSNPFKHLSGNAGAGNDADDVDAANHRIFVYNTGTASGGLTLNSGEWLVGQGAQHGSGFDGLMGITPPAGTLARPAINTTKSTITSGPTGINGVNLASNNQLYGLEFKDTDGTAVSGTVALGTLLMADIEVDNTSAISGGGYFLTGGGTVTATGTNTILTESGTALFVTNTNIGAANMTFTSISAGNNNADPDPSNGILLSSTGTSGSLIVTGNGNTSQGGNNSGGVIQNTTGAGISLTNTQSPSFTNMRLFNTVGDGILGTRVTNFTFKNGTIDDSGTAPNESNISFRGDTSGSASNLSGVVTITDNVLNNAFYHGVDIQNFVGTISDANINGNSITSPTAIANSQGSGIRLIAFGSATTAAHVTKANINNNVIQNFPVGDGIQVQGGNSAVGGPSTTMGQSGNATNIVNITGNRVAGQSAANKLGGNAIVAAYRGTGQANNNIDGNGTVANPITNVLGIGIALSAFGPMNITGTINNNRLSALGNIFGSQGILAGIDSHFGLADAGTMTVKITNNNVSGHDGNGIYALTRNSAATLNATIENNIVAMPLGGVRPGIRVDSNTIASGDTTVCLDISGNTSAGSGGAQGIGLRKQGTAPAINAFGIEGMAATATPGVEAFVDGLNPAGGGTLLISATSGFTSCGTAPNGPVIFNEGDGGAPAESLKSGQPNWQTGRQIINANVEAIRDRVEAEQQPMLRGATGPVLVIVPTRMWSDMPQSDEDEQKSDEDDAEKESDSAEPEKKPAPKKKRVTRTETYRPAERNQNTQPEPAQPEPAQPEQPGVRNISYVGPLGAAPSRAPRFVRASYTADGARALKAARTAPAAKTAPKAAKAVARTAALAAAACAPSATLVCVDIGDMPGFNPVDMPAPKSVTIRFKVEVDNPFLGVQEQIENQGSVSYDESASAVLTDDPDDVTSNTDKTITLVAAPPEINVHDANVTEPASGSTEMVFTVTLSRAPTSVVTVDFATAADALGANPATAGTDYTATNNTLTFQVGQRVQSISVLVQHDAGPPETDETFLVQLSNASAGSVIGDGEATGTITQTPTPGTFLISEIRTSGPDGADDDFIELYNNRDVEVEVTTTDGSPGWGVYTMGANCATTPVLYATIPNGTKIPPRGHYLITGPDYSLADYGGTGAAVGDLPMASGLAADANVAVFNTTDVANLSVLTRLDAVGFGTNVGNNCNLLREGSNLGAAGGSTLEHSYFRKLCDFVNGQGCQVDGTAKDTNVNASDFLFADTLGTQLVGTGHKLGAPGPENLNPATPTSPRKTDLVIPLFLDRSVGGPAAPNRFRDLDAPEATHGTMSIRRRFVNNTGADVTRLRFRISEMTTFPRIGGNAELRAFSSSLVSVSGVNDSGTCGAAPKPCTVDVQGTTLEQEPTQTLGGGLNATLTVTLGTPLPDGESINVQFLLGVQHTGLFRFLIVTETLP